MALKVRLRSPDHIYTLTLLYHIFPLHTQVPYIEVGTVCIEGKTKSVKSFFTKEESDELTGKIQNRGGEIIKKQNLSSGLSAAGAIARHLSDLFSEGVSADSNGDMEGEDDYDCDEALKGIKGFSCGTLSDGNPYGVPEGIVFSFPCHLQDGVVRIIPNLPLDGSMIRMMNTSVGELMAEREDAETFLINLPTPKL